MLTIRSVNISEEKGTVKTARELIQLDASGIAGDACRRLAPQVACWEKGLTNLCNWTRRNFLTAPLQKTSPQRDPPQEVPT